MNERDYLAAHAAHLRSRIRGEAGDLATDLAEPLRIEQHTRSRPPLGVSIAAVAGFCTTFLLRRRARRPSDAELRPGLVARLLTRASRLTGRTLEAALWSGLTPRPDAPSESAVDDPAASTLQDDAPLAS